eukprot:3122255-Pleurochrysis_carterae.AAC.2
MRYAQWWCLLPLLKIATARRPCPLFWPPVAWPVDRPRVPANACKGVAIACECPHVQAAARIAAPCKCLCARGAPSAPLPLGLAYILTWRHQHPRATEPLFLSRFRRWASPRPRIRRKRRHALLEICEQCPCSLPISHASASYAPQRGGMDVSR